MEQIDRILSSASLLELWEAELLPEPYDDSGFYLVYYAEDDYKTALSDVVQYVGAGLRIFYDRHLETGEFHRREFARQALNTHCRAVVFYLSEAAMGDPTLHTLAATVAEYNIPFLSVNIGKEGNERSGAAMAAALPLQDEAREHINLLFADEITYLPAIAPFAEKHTALLRAGRAASMRYRLEGDFAVASYVRDLSEEEIVIPPYVEIDGTPYPVRAVEARAFAGCTHLRRVRLPDTLEILGLGCEDPSAAAVFAGCESLSELTIPPRVGVLYGGMLRGCRSLRRLTLPEDAVFAGDPAAFFDLRDPLDSDPVPPNEDDLTVAASFDLLTLPRAAQIVSTVRDYVGCVLPAEDRFAYVLLRLGHFEGGTRVKIERDHTLKSPAELFCFSGNTEVERVTAAPDYTFGPGWNSVFHNCTSLREVTLPETVRTTSRLFSGCTALKRVHLPSSLAEIGALTFSGCKSLGEITLPRYLCALEENALVGSEIEVIVSDSLYSEAIFAGGVPYPYRVLATKNRLLRALRKACVRLSYRLNDPDTLSEKPFYMWGAVRTIYITNEVRPFPLYGCRQVQSDRPGYRKYHLTLTEVERLRYIEGRIRRMKH